tara:strand:+ start:1291 stop:1698 length:408 start_codon:yes stop_codon:yes gene_type:complete
MPQIPGDEVRPEDEVQPVVPPRRSDPRDLFSAGNPVVPDGIPTIESSVRIGPQWAGVGEDPGADHNGCQIRLATGEILFGTTDDWEQLKQRLLIDILDDDQIEEIRCNSRLVRVRYCVLPNGLPDFRSLRVLRFA